MTATLALIKREYLEHRTAFLYAPAVLMLVIFGTLGLSLFVGTSDFSDVPAEFAASPRPLAIITSVAFLAWTVYLLITLVFYFSDSFSADRKNNAMLFWKSMPQSDLKILTTKALAGATIFPALIFGFGLISGVLLYLLSFRVSALLPFNITPGFFEFIGSFIQVSLVALTFFILTILWYAPVLAWVAGLSTRFGGWSIPLAIVIPFTVTLLESIILYGGAEEDGPIAHYLGYRMNGLFGSDLEEGEFLTMWSRNILEMIPQMLSEMDWVQTGIGLIFTAAVIYVASEYRRRRITA